MKDRYLINYNLFCTKRNFNLLVYLIANKNETYENFSDLMRSKSVNPPSITYFNEVKNKADSVNFSEKGKAIPVETEKDDIVDKVLEKIDKPKRKRRTKKKVEKNW